MARPAAATEFPLHLCQVLEEELEALLPEAGPEPGKPLPASPWDFTPEQIRERTLPGLLARLHDPGDEVCKWLRPRLSSTFRLRLEQRERAGGPAAGELREALADELNLLLREEGALLGIGELARACRIEGIRLSEEMEMLLADPPADRPRLLRLLLEEIFPAELEASGERRLREVYRRVHAHPHGLAALCLSGGGIRSAVFGLGVVQGLARRNLLHAFDYLSTVSGGGYLGGLLSAWIHRHPRGLDGVSDELGGRVPGARKLQPEPAPLDYMRNFSNYLTPKLGVLSADSWTLISIFLRNLYVYWLVLVPLLLAVLVVPRLYVAVCTAKNIVPWGPPLSLPFLDAPAYLLPDGLFVLGSLLMTFALGYIGWNRPSGGRRSTTRGFLLACLLPLV
ncbi:MAG TPA: patatin-like phospholipase family protein, partial [Thermoanaerobaculia bacterium]|nr:patatin-like phospholipase family protein [Thermoanaerobaculia bacterium]